ncbi:hypothetical protein N9C88_02355 [Candidatus Pseudothioglobus singularis]|nr:hypothetical protein [Candidatus Pseudothioglobus singularis]
MKKLITLILISISLTSNSIADENWSLIEDTRLITRGDIVWGHQFGFMKDLSLCGYDVMLLSWSTDISDGKLKEFEGKDAYVQINMDGEVLDQELEFTLMFAGDFGSMEVGYFGAIVKSESFIKKLKQSSKIELTFSKPNKLIKILDIKTDSFKTEGLDESYSMLDNSCPVIM